jgi:hypothetical protein
MKTRSPLGVLTASSAKTRTISTAANTNQNASKRSFFSGGAFTPNAENAGLYLIYCMHPYGKNLPVPKGEPMTALPYDIFKRTDGETLVWVEAMPDLDTANARIKKLQKSSGEEYVVFNQRTQQVVPSCPTS